MNKGICLCLTYPGCRNAPPDGERLCSVCLSAGHQAYTDEQVEALRRSPFAVEIEEAPVGSGKWVANATRFESETEADQYGRNLLRRWSGAGNYRVIDHRVDQSVGHAR